MVTLLFLEMVDVESQLGSRWWKQVMVVKQVKQANVNQEEAMRHLMAYQAPVSLWQWQEAKQTLWVMEVVVCVLVLRVRVMDVVW